MAEVVSSAAWGSLDLEPDIERLDMVTRLLLAGYWTDLGRTKHAAVGRFARLTVALLQLGAPPEIVQRAQSAGGAELRHARLAFTLASAFRLSAVGPGALPVAEDVEAGVAPLVALIVETCCLSATAESLELRALHDRAEDPAVRFVLSETSREASEQVLFGWRTLQWLCEEHGEPARSAVREQLDRVAEETAAARSEPPRYPLRDESLLRSGYASALVRRDMRLTALERVAFGLRALTEKGLPPGDEADRVTVV